MFQKPRQSSPVARHHPVQGGGEAAYTWQCKYASQQTPTRNMPQNMGQRRRPSIHRSVRQHKLHRAHALRIGDLGRLLGTRLGLAGNERENIRRDTRSQPIAGTQAQRAFPIVDEHQVGHNNEAATADKAGEPPFHAALVRLEILVGMAPGAGLLPSRPPAMRRFCRCILCPSCMPACTLGARASPLCLPGHFGPVYHEKRRRPRPANSACRKKKKVAFTEKTDDVRNLLQKRAGQNRRRTRY